MPRLLFLAIIVAVVAAGCGSAAPVGPLPPAPEPTTLEAVEAEISEGGAPTVVNVWASWCLPCRSEAPLIAAAAASHPEVRFIGLNVRDDPNDARRFMAEYLDDVEMLHLSDRSGRIPIDLGATSGVPVTFFYRSDGTLAQVHLGIIDEPTMARLIDEIDR